jgi:hypothetical protein
MSYKYIVSHDDKVIAECSTETEAFAYVLGVQGQSVDYATTYGGYEIKKQTFAEQVKESVNFVVDMMNSGKVKPSDVYPKGRYSGD